VGEDRVRPESPDLAHEKLPQRQLGGEGAVRLGEEDGLVVADDRGGGVNHADHRAAGLAAVDAVFPAARNPMAFPALARAGLAAHPVRRVYLFWPNEPTAWVDVGATLERKLAALGCHASQIAEPAELLGRVRRWAAEEGESIGALAAEAFRIIVIDDDPDEGPHDLAGG
jgi:LmbE family N-acetylglucosaminyl deacetylase